MRLRSAHGYEVDAYLVSSYDEHQKCEADDDDSRLKFISGFSGPVGSAVVSVFLVANCSHATSKIVDRLKS